MSTQLLDLRNVDAKLFEVPGAEQFEQVGTPTHAPRILLLYGSLRARSLIKLLTLEAQRLLDAMGAEARVYSPEGLPLPDGHPEDHPKVQELRELAAWSEGMVWTSPERHGAMTGIMKAQIDWIPLIIGSVRPTQGKILAVMEVSGGSQSFNAVNQLRILGRWMRMITIPNQSSLADTALSATAVLIMHIEINANRNAKWATVAAMTEWEGVTKRQFIISSLN